MNESKLNVITLTLLPAYAPKLQWRCISAVIVAIKGTLGWVQKECNLPPSGSVSFDLRFLYGKITILVWSKVSDIYSKSIWF